MRVSAVVPTLQRSGRLRTVASAAALGFERRRIVRERVGCGEVQCDHESHHSDRTERKISEQFVRCKRLTSFCVERGLLEEESSHKVVCACRIQTLRGGIITDVNRVIGDVFPADASCS